jgi:hypothetical protein
MINMLLISVRLGMLRPSPKPVMAGLDPATQCARVGGRKIKMFTGSRTLACWVAGHGEQRGNGCAGVA